MCKHPMASFLEELEVLKRESEEYFRTKFESPEAETNENVRIKSRLLDLINKAKQNGCDSIATEVKSAVIDYLCDVCGHSEDLEILQNHTPSVLSSNELEYIIQNSALSRWF